MDKELNFSSNAEIVLQKRYLKKNNKGKVIETPKEMLERVSSHIASVEKKYSSDPKIVEKRKKDFFDMMANLEFMPNSPTLMNAGKDLGQLSACFVVPVDDSMESIFEEYRVPHIQIPGVRSKHKEPVIIRDVVLWGLIKGEIMMDLHWILEALLLKKIDDTNIFGLALFRYQNVPYVAATGYGKSGRRRSGLLDIQKNKICFPATFEQKAIAGHLQRRVMNLLARRGVKVEPSILKKMPKNQ